MAKTKTPRVHEVTGEPNRAPYRVNQTLGKAPLPKRGIGPAPIHSGMTSQQVAQAGTKHLIAGAPDASNANPLDTLSTSQMGKRHPPTMVHDGMTRQQIAGATFNGEDILREAMGLPAATRED
jgi:hypothetical protein